MWADFYNEMKNPQLTLENPAYKKWNFIDWKEREKWIKSISIGDLAVYTDSQSSVFIGEVEMINNYGMDISIYGKYTFVRFPNVQRVIKRNS